MRFFAPKSALCAIREFGAIALPSGDDAVNERLRLVKSQAPRGVDLVVEVAGTAPVLPEGVSMLRVGGTYGEARLEGSRNWRCVAHELFSRQLSRVWCTLILDSISSLPSS
jgi:threonine dehydrogenase-like Zn-dependent dehydrogenase